MFKMAQMIVKVPREKMTMRTALRFSGSLDLAMIEVGIKIMHKSEEILKHI